MSEKKIPSLRQLIWSIIVGLKCHPKLSDPPVYYPLIRFGNEPQQIFITKWKDFDGGEFVNNSLTCSIFPKYTNKSLTSNTGDVKSVTIEPYELSRGLYKVTYNLIIQLHYQDIAINNFKTLKYYILDSPQGLITPHGLNFYMDDSDKFTDGQHLRRYNERIAPMVDQIKQIRQFELDVEINPAEEILRDYMDLLRVCLDEIYQIVPWSIKSAKVVGYDFPSSSWQSQETNIIFHTAYLEWQVVMYAPNSSLLKGMSPVPINSIDYQQILKSR